MRVLAFDIGIKNLAWCCADVDLSGNAVVRGWSNENLVTGGTAESDKESGKCSDCSKKAAYWNETNGYCVRHCPSSMPALRDLSGCLLKKIPAVAVLKAIAKGAGAGAGAGAVVTKEDLKTKETVLKFLRGKYCFPKLATAVKKVELEDIHDGLRKVVLTNRELFASCSTILLENQPAFKNPVMKSVQMMLFATLRDILGSGPKVRLVHASRKNKGDVVAKGDEGYADRKNATETKVLKGLEQKKIVMNCSDSRDSSWFRAQAKRSDLADCLLMTIDFASASA